MFPRTLFAAALAAALALPQAAEAWSGRTTANLVIRDGPGTGYGRLTVIPAGKTVEVYHCAGWCKVYYAGRYGWVHGSYLARSHAPLASTLTVSPVPTPRGTKLKPVYVPPRQAYLASAPFRPPSRERADWYAGRAFYFDGRFFDRPDLFFVYGR